MKLRNQEHKEPLHVRLRPTTLDEVIGQDAVVRALKRRDKNIHSFLFAGPSGTGKTTLGRIVAKGELFEIDAATHTGIDAMRELVNVVTTPSIMNPGGHRTVIVDECHRLSRPTWDSLLKIVEEPPKHLHWVFCTTDIGKVPVTIVNRCQTYNLKPILSTDLAQYMYRVADNEGLKVSESLVRIAAKQANGSVRQALAYLSVLNGVKDEDEAQALMQTAEERKEVIDFIRYLVFDRSRTWDGIRQHLQGLKEQDVDAESIRIVTVNYISACILGAKSEKEVQRLMTLLAQFSTPYNASEKYGPLLLSLGNCLY